MSKGTSTHQYLSFKHITKKRRKVIRLTLFHKILYGNVYVTLTQYLHARTRYTRSSLRSRLTSVSVIGLPMDVMSISGSNEFKLKVAVSLIYIWLLFLVTYCTNTDFIK